MHKDVDIDGVVTKLCPSGPSCSNDGTTCTLVGVRFRVYTQNVLSLKWHELV